MLSDQYSFTMGIREVLVFTLLAVTGHCMPFQPMFLINPGLMGPQGMAPQGIPMDPSMNPWFPFAAPPAPAKPEEVQPEVKTATIENKNDVVHEEENPSLNEVINSEASEVPPTPSPVQPPTQPEPQPAQPVPPPPTHQEPQHVYPSVPNQGEAQSIPQNQNPTLPSPQMQGPAMNPMGFPANQMFNLPFMFQNSAFGPTMNGGGSSPNEKNPQVVYIVAVPMRHSNNNYQPVPMVVRR